LQDSNLEEEENPEDRCKKKGEAFEHADLARKKLIQEKLRTRIASTAQFEHGNSLQLLGTRQCTRVGEGKKEKQFSPKSVLWLRGETTCHEPRRRGREKGASGRLPEKRDGRRRSKRFLKKTVVSEKGTDRGKIATKGRGQAPESTRSYGSTKKREVKGAARQRERERRQGIRRKAGRRRKNAIDFGENARLAKERNASRLEKRCSENARLLNANLGGDLKVNDCRIGVPRKDKKRSS